MFDFRDLAPAKQKRAADTIAICATYHHVIGFTMGGHSEFDDDVWTAFQDYWGVYDYPNEQPCDAFDQFWNLITCGCVLVGSAPFEEGVTIRSDVPGKVIAARLRGYWQATGKKVPNRNLKFFGSEIRAVEKLMDAMDKDDEELRTTLLARHDRARKWLAEHWSLRRRVEAEIKVV